MELAVRELNGSQSSESDTEVCNMKIHCDDCSAALIIVADGGIDVLQVQVYLPEAKQLPL